MKKNIFDENLKQLNMNPQEFIQLMEYLKQEANSNVVDIESKLTPFNKAIRKQKRKKQIKRRLKLIDGGLS